MDVFPEFTVDDLAEFTGRNEMTFPAYADEALSQAVFFIKLRTKVNNWPVNSDLQRLFRYAILELANIMIYERESDRYLSLPFSSESIASYSYAKSNAVKEALYRSRPTGRMWLDTLLDFLDEIEMAMYPLRAHGSVHVFENEGVYLTEDDERYVLGPRDIPDRRFGLGIGDLPYDR